MKNEKQFNEAWWRRKAVYVLVAVVGLVLTGFGVVTQDQVDAFTASPLLATAIGFFAASKTNAGSDSTVTAQDVAIAASLNHGGPSPEAIVIETLKKVNGYGEHALGEVTEVAERVKSATGSVADYYASQE